MLVLFIMYVVKYTFGSHSVKETYADVSYVVYSFIQPVVIIVISVYNC